MPYPNATTNVLFTNVNGSGDDVLVYTSLPSEVLIKAYKNQKKVTFDEAYPIKDEEVQFYIHEPCWLTEDEEAKAKELASA